METLLILSDLHVASTVGLSKPTMTLDDGGTYKASKGQRWLYSKWEELLSTVEAKKQGALYTVVNGDAVEGDTKDRSYQLATRNPATAVRWAAELLDPLVQLSTGLFVIRGTPAHGGKSGNLEESLAEDLGAIPCPATGTSSWWSMLYNCAGVRIDLAHKPKGGTGGRPANARAAIDRLAADTEFEYCERGEPLPHLVIRSHVHKHRDSGRRFRVRAITTPAWTLPTEYIRQLDPHGLADVGAILVYCEAGHYEVELLKYQPAANHFASIREIYGHNRK